MTNDASTYLSSYISLTSQNIHIWSPRRNWPFQLLGNSLFLGLSSFLYMMSGFTFSDSHTDLFPLIHSRAGPSNMES